MSSQVLHASDSFMLIGLMQSEKASVMTTPKCLGTQI